MRRSDTLDAVTAANIGITVLAAMVAVYEAALGALLRGQPTQRWASMIAAVTAGYAGAEIVLQYGADTTLVVASAAQLFCLLALPFALIGFAEAYTHRRLLVPRWLRRAAPVGLAVAGGWAALAPLYAGSSAPASSFLFGAVLLTGVVTAVWLGKHGGRTRQTAVISGALGVWLLFGLHDLLRGLGFFETPAIFQFGFACLAVALWGTDVYRYAVMLTEVQAARAVLSAQYRAVTSTVGEGILLMNPLLQVLRTNPSMRTLLAVEPTAGEKMPLAEALGDDEAAARLAGAARRVRAGEVVHIGDLLLKGGRCRASCMMVPHRSIRGVDGILAIFRDETRDHLARLALERSERNFRTLTEGSPLLVIVHRGQQVVYVSPSVVSALGFRSAEDLLEQPLVGLVHSDDRLRVAHVPEDVDEEEPDRPSVAIRLLRQDGGIVDAEVTELAIHFDGEASIALVGSDVTARRRMLAREMQVDRMVSVGTLAAGVAHEINNPLAYMIANLDFSVENLQRLEGVGLPDGTLQETQGYLDEARAGARRVRDIVQDLARFSKADVGTEVLEINTLIQSALSMVSNEVRHRAQLVTHLCEPSPRVVGNETRLCQVFVNLLVNAAQAIGTGDVDRNIIRVRSRLTGGSVVVEVADTGHGISEEHHNMVFEPFFTTKSASEGTGLGLAICRETVVSMGGNITMTSHLGQGTTFQVQLPLTSSSLPVVPVTPPKNTARQAAPGGLVLVVDDEPSICRAVQRALRRHHHVVTTTSARDALDALASGARYDCILCDLMMPEMSGMDLYRAVARISPDQTNRIVFLTGGAFAEDARQFLDDVENPRLTKPFDVAELRHQVGKLVGTTQVAQA